MEIPVEKHSDHLIIRLPSVIGTDLQSDWEKATDQWLAESVGLYVFDFKNTIEIKNNAYRLLISFSQSVQKNNKRISSIHLSDFLMKQIKADGIDKKLNPVADLAAATKPAQGGSKQAVDLVILNHFISSTQTTLEVQASTPCTPGKPFVMKGEGQRSDLPVAIAGIIPIVSDKFKGSISVCFPREVFLKIYSAMVGEDAPEITPEMKDAAAEIMNIIYGGAKTELNKVGGFDLKPSLPTVIAGDNLMVHKNANTPVLVIPFTVSSGKFQIEIALEAA